MAVTLRSAPGEWALKSSATANAVQGAAPEQAPADVTVDDGLTRTFKLAAADIESVDLLTTSANIFIRHFTVRVLTSRNGSSVREVKVEVQRADQAYVALPPIEAAANEAGELTMGPFKHDAADDNAEKVMALRITNTGDVDCDVFVGLAGNKES